LEISAGWKWRVRQWRSFSEMNWPEHDICNERLDRQFDILIADNVWEHLLYPYRAARNVHAMLRPGGWFVNITPFLIRYHPIPTDCSRWTELGMKHFLEEAGFDPERVVTGSWGNASAPSKPISTAGLAHRLAAAACLMTSAFPSPSGRWRRSHDVEAAHLHRCARA
jgi:SAM-dependent methyltransferase